VFHGLIYGSVITGYLFIFMILVSPRVWGYADYPQRVKDKVPPQTRREKILASLIGIPWFLILLGFPIWSTLQLKHKLGGIILFWIAFLNVFSMFFWGTFGDLVLLDWLLISRITPRFVIIPGSKKEDYRDFSHHFRGHLKASVVMVFMCLIVAAALSFF
jgi:hypothetical protein